MIGGIRPGPSVECGFLLQLLPSDPISLLDMLLKPIVDQQLTEEPANGSPLGLEVEGGTLVIC